MCIRKKIWVCLQSFKKSQQAKISAFTLEKIAFQLYFPFLNLTPHIADVNVFPSHGIMLLFFPVRTVISEEKLYQGFLQVFGCAASQGKYFVWRRYLDVIQTVWGASLSAEEKGKPPPIFFHETWQIFRMCLTVLCWFSYPGEKFWLCGSSHHCSCQLLWSQAEAGLPGAGRSSFLPPYSGVGFVGGFPLGRASCQVSELMLSCSSPFLSVVE